jgi:Rap1a immunity proteins
MRRAAMLPWTIAAALAVVLGSRSAIAVQDEDVDLDTTEDLYQVCSVQPGAAEYVATSFACRGFIEGAVQYHDAVSDRKHLKRLICYPKTATVADGRAAFVAWAQRNLGNRKVMEEVPVIGLVRALADKYPCN